jgi:hypothetical protein
MRGNRPEAHAGVTWLTAARFAQLSFPFYPFSPECLGAVAIPLEVAGMMAKLDSVDPSLGRLDSVDFSLGRLDSVDPSLGRLDSVDFSLAIPATSTLLPCHPFYPEYHCPEGWR